LLYERLSWTPTERIEKHLQMLEFANELRKAAQNIVANLNVENLLKKFQRLRVEFAIIGGMAAVLHGSLATADLDFRYSNSNHDHEHVVFRGFD
jgi:hypothetical protein